MNNLDFKSILIGGLIVSCLLLLMGQKKSNNLGHIQVESITIKANDEHGGFIQLDNYKNERIGYFGEDKNGDGNLQLMDKDGRSIIFLGNKDGGLVQTYYEGINWALLGSNNEGGYVSLRSGKDDVFFGAMVFDKNPIIALWNRFGDLEWGEGFK